MSGAADDERLWWAMESDFELSKFDDYEFDGYFCGPVAATVGQTSFTWRVVLCPKGSIFINDDDEDGGRLEERDSMCILVRFVDGPIDKLESVKYKAKVYNADGSLAVSRTRDRSTDMLNGDWYDCARLPMTRDQLRPYLLGKEGSEYVRMRVEVGIRKSSFDPLAMLPLPPPRQDVNERLARWYCSGAGVVKLVASDGTHFTVYKDLLSDSSEALVTLRPRKDRRIHFDGLCGDALGELVSFIIITFGSTRPSRVRQYVIELLDVSERYNLPDLKVVCERAVVEKIQAQPADLLELLEAAELDDLRVAMDLGLCRLLKVFHQLSDADQDLFNSADYADIRKRFMNLSSQSQLAVKHV